MTEDRPAWREGVRTAPRDGRRVELRTETFGRTVRQETCVWGWRTSPDGRSTQGWWVVGGPGLYPGTPTHWRWV